ncbi:MAG: hypothetical protein HQL54_02320 [Magnetococcales bacterium]|nr:hypothetical protein [Magnetococcales bacterium]
MAKQAMRSAGVRIYGEGLVNGVYIRNLAKELKAPESSVRRWWYGTEKNLPKQTQIHLDQLMAQTSSPHQICERRHW